MASDSQTTEFRGGQDEQHDRLKRLGKYLIKRKLGAGGMGTVFLAVDQDLNRTVALKVLPKERAENPTLVRRFKAEAQAAAQLEHKNIVHIYEAGQVDGFLYIALEYVDGIDVHELVARRGVLPVKRSIDMVKQVARALDHALSRHIVHRDIKPANLLIKRDGTVKLADMGLARSVDENIQTSITRAGMTVGTVDYMSPEQARSSQAADVRSDIYSLGCTWYHMLTGNPPFPDGGLTEKLQAHAMGKRPDPRSENPAIPESVVSVMHRMMSRKPQDRHQTPQELIDDLDLAVRNLGTFDSAALDALASESGPTRSRKSRSAPAPAALPPKETFKPVDLTKSRNVDVDVLKLALPAVAVVALLAVFVWIVLRSDDDPERISGVATPFPGHVQQADQDASIVDQEPDDESAAAPADPEVASQLPSASASSVQQPPSVVAIPFPGAEDTPTSSTGVPLIPNWVEKFRHQGTRRAPTMRVTRRASSANEYRRLNDALEAMPPEGGIIEIDGDGPFVLEPATIVSRGEVRVVAAPDRFPVIFLANSSRTPPDGTFLKVQATLFEMQNLHLAMVDPPRSNTTLLRIDDGDVSLQNCSITVDGGRTRSVTALTVGGQSSSNTRRRVSSSTSGQCLLENVLFRGERMTAVHLMGSASELVAGNCLIHSGDEPAIVITDTDGGETTPRSMRLLATTLISRRAAMRFTRTGDHSPANYEVIVRQSILASASGAGSGANPMLLLDGWELQTANIGSSRAAGIDWSTEQTHYLGWESLVRVYDAQGNELVNLTSPDEWRPFWNKALASDAVARLSQLPPAFSRPVSITPGDVAPDRLAPVLKQQLPSSVGCRAKDLTHVPFGMLEHVMVASRAPDVAEGIGAEMTVEPTPVRIDLSRRASLSNFLASDGCRDGTHIIATGSGLYKLDPFELDNKSIRLEFRQGSGNPLIIQVSSDSNSSAPGSAILVRNGKLDLVGARLKLPATSAASHPQWLIGLENASISIRSCSLEGPSTPSPEHGGLIQFLEEGNAENSHVLVEDSFLLSPGDLISGPVRWSTLVLRNSVLVTQANALTFKLDAPGLQSLASAVIDHCTFAAGKSVFHFEGAIEETGDESPLQMFITSNLFSVAPGSRSTAAATVVSRDSETLTDQFVHWWGNANGFAPTLKSFVTTAGTPEPASNFKETWTALWGAGHEGNPLSETRDIAFAASFPEWKELQPSHFAVNSGSLAATWAVDRTPVGADVGQVGADAISHLSEDDASPAGAARGPTRTRPRSQNRNPF